LLTLAFTGCNSSKQQTPLDLSKLPKEVRERIEKARYIPDDVKAVLDNPEHFTLLSIYGEEYPPDITSDTKFHGYDFLGKTEIEDVLERKALIDALYQSIAESTGPALCFGPRHAVRAVKGDEIVDLVICFECQQIRILTENPKHVGEHNVSTTDKPAAAFNAALSRRKVQLAPPPEAK
jgi:hypothetical protein